MNRKSFLTVIIGGIASAATMLDANKESNQPKRRTGKIPLIDTSKCDAGNLIEMNRNGLIILRQ